MPALDDSSSITASEENNGKTPPEIDIQKMLKKWNPWKKAKGDIKYSLTKETEGLKDSSDCMLPSVRDSWYDQHSSCKSIGGLNHFTLTNHPNSLQGKVNKERQLKFLKSTIGSSVGFGEFQELEVSEFQKPRKSSWGQFDITTPKTPLQLKKRIPNKGVFHNVFQDHDWRNHGSKPRKLSSIGRDHYRY